MSDQQTHFASAFEVHSEVLDPNVLWTAIMEEARGWLLNRKLPRRADIAQVMQQDWFIRGCADPLRLAHHTLQTASFSGEYAQDQPQFWSLRYEHDDSEGRGRRWRTDIGLSRAKSSVAFSIRVSHSVEPDWFGKPLTPPAHSVPGVVQEIVCQQKQWHASIGGNQLFCKAFDISAKNVPALVSALLSKDRTIPLIVVSNAEATGEPLVVPNELAKSVAGMASVLRIKDVDAKKVFDASMPDRFRVFNGAIRIYQPGLDFERYLDSYRHRYFTEADIVDFGMSVVGSAVVKSSLRQERGGTQDAVSSLEDVRFREFTTKLVANSENSALVEPLFAEIDNQRKKYDDLFEDYQKLYGQWESSVAAKEGLESDLREQERTIGALSFRLRQTKAESNSTEKATPSFVDSVLAATGGTKIVCVRSKQDGSYLRAVQTIFSLTEADSNRLFEEVEAEHSSNQVQSLIKAYAGRIVVYAWGHLKSMDADETKGFREFFEGQSTSRALQWLVQWVNSVTNS